MFVQNFLKLSAVVHELSGNRVNKNFTTMLKTILPWLPRAVTNFWRLQLKLYLLRFVVDLLYNVLYREIEVVELELFATICSEW